MPITETQFNVQTPLSPAALLDQPQQSGEFDRIFQFLFNRRGRPDVPDEPAGPSTPARDPIKDLMLTAIFGDDIPQAQEVVGSAAPPVEPFRPETIEGVLR